MIYLLALTSILVMLPLTVLVCIKREKRDKLAFSAEVTHTHKTSVSTPPAAKPPPLPPQPHSDGTTQKDAATSTTKKEETDKQAATVTISRGRIVRSRARTPRPESSEFGASRRDRDARDASTRKWSPRQHYLEAPATMLSAGRQRRSPELAAKREVARTPGGQRRVSPQGCSAATGPLSKLSRKSRKASQPRSPSMKEFPMKPRIAQSKTELTALASVKNVDGNKSALTALSEYVFEEGKYKVLGKVDQVIGQSDETDVLNKALVTEQSRTCVSVTNPARSPFFDGQFDVWIADRVGSQAEG